MNIYEILNHLNSTKAHGHKKHFLKKDHPELYQYILSHYHLTTNSSFPEIFYCIQYDITCTPTCPTCSRVVTWDIPSQSYHTFCSSKCSIHIAIDKATSNESKQKRMATVQERYGVDNVSHLSEVRKTISDGMRERQKIRRDSKEYTNDGMDFVTYRHRAYQYSNTMYENYKDIIDPDNLRGKEYHLDHVYSVFDGFQNDVPVNMISHWSNLQIITARDNMSKNTTSWKSLEALHEDYHNASND